MKLPSFTEWVFGIVLLLTLQLIGLIIYVPLVLITGNDSSRLSCRSPAQSAVLLVGVVIVPIIVFRWSRFYVRVIKIGIKIGVTSQQLTFRD